MEEERQHFGQLMKDARRRFDEFLTSLEKNKPFLLRRQERRSAKECGEAAVEEPSRRLYRKMSCKSENSDEDLKIGKMKKSRPINRQKKIKNRLRHSVIGTGKEFSDFEGMFLLEESVYRACHDEEADAEAEQNAEDALAKYINELYTNDLKTKQDDGGCIVGKASVTGSSLLDATMERAERGKILIRKSLSNEFQRSKKRMHRRSSSYFLRSRLAITDAPISSAEKNNFLVWDENSCLALTKEQKRRVKEKMKQAMKRPDNYSYLGNL